MSLSAILYAYVIGGLTFIPLLILVIVVPAWLTLPRPSGGIAKEIANGQDKKDLNGEEGHAQEQDELSSYDSAASASFAVLRAYNFQSALAALNAKSGTTPGNGSEGSTETGSQESMSVYQSMYRSVFDRNKTAAQKLGLAEAEEIEGPVAPKQKPSTTPATIFFIVLRHHHLMLYDSPAQLEVRHVISLAHHTLSLSDGDDEEFMMDGDLFVKRTAICLRPTLATTNGVTALDHAGLPKPFYLFSATCIEKEDFYHALLTAQSDHPIPQSLDSACTIKLQSSLHSSSQTPETRAINVLVGRIFLALHRTPFLQDLIRSKIEKKIARVQKPAFIASINVQGIDLGDMAPVISNLRLKDLNISGDMTLSADVKYTGAFKVVIAAVAKLDLGARFKVRTIDLVLAASLQRLQGRLLVRVKPPPSNRIWFCFEEMPVMEVKIEPVVSTRQITYTFILKAIENRIREVVAETVVKPNWDDVPFFDTSAQLFRGGIWQKPKYGVVDSQRSNDTSDAELRKPISETDQLGMSKERTASMPALAGSDLPDDHRATAATGMESRNLRGSSTLKSRSVMSLPPPSHSAQLAAERATTERTTTFHPPRPLRSPSFNSTLTAPSVAVDGSNAVKSDDVARAPAKRWIGRAPVVATMRDAVDAVREVHDRASHHSDATDSAGLSAPSIDMAAEMGSEDDLVDADTEISKQHASSRPGSQGRGSTSHVSQRLVSSHAAATASNGPTRTSTMRSSASSSTSREQAQAKGKNLLAATAAATTAATTAARQWAWNAAASRKKGEPILRPRRSHGELASVPQEPMGRGQPLPPPGTPLPKPPKASLWGTSGFAGGSVKRKPALPARRSGIPAELRVSGASEKSAASSSGNLPRASGEDEFGPWSENFEEHSHAQAPTGVANLDEHASARDTDPPIEETQRQAPPLPLRRKKLEGPGSSGPRTDSVDSDAASSPAHNLDFATLEDANGLDYTERIQHLDHRAADEDESRAAFETTESPAAAPAPVSPEVEQRGVLAIEERDGLHIIDDDGDHIVLSVGDEQTHSDEPDPARDHRDTYIPN